MAMPVGRKIIETIKPGRRVLVSAGASGIGRAIADIRMLHESVLRHRHGGSDGSAIGTFQPNWRNRWRPAFGGEADLSIVSPTAESDPDCVNTGSFRASECGSLIGTSSSGLIMASGLDCA